VHNLLVYLYPCILYNHAMPETFIPKRPVVTAYPRMPEAFAEAEAMSVYLPKQLTDEQVSVVVRRVISDSGANGLADMGKTIGAVKSELGNTADGSVIARLVKQELSEG